MYWLRHLIAVLALPGTAVVFVPVWVARRFGVQADWPTSALDWVLVCCGLLVSAAGASLFVASLHHFFTIGRGTLAPWDPPRRLVVRGPYRYVRNPMISGVIMLLCGLALLLRSAPHAVWAGVFVILNTIYIPLLEEPDLAARFGEDYAHYRKHVRRFLPRLTAWNAGSSAKT